MGIGDVFRSAGLSFADVGFVKFNAAFPPMVAVAHFGLKNFITSTMSTTAMAMLPVPPAKIPLFAIAMMPVVAVTCAVTAIMGITIYSPTGYASHKNREQKAAGNLAANGMPAWLDRMQGAQYNTWEATICLLCAVFVATTSDFGGILTSSDKVGFLAKLSTFFLLCRVVYPIAYALDIDLLRTQLWFNGLYATLVLSFGALFPDSIVPMFWY